jgi:hypothetical protein
MSFCLFPHFIFQCIFYTWVPNMASLPGPNIYFHHSDVQGGVLELLHTHLGFFFPKVFYLFISHNYSLSIILYFRREYSTSRIFSFSSHFNLTS